MIAVVGRPAESKLGQIARAYYKSARLIGDVHKHLCAFSCLTVFKYHGQIIYIVSDVQKMLFYAVGYVNLTQGDAYRLAYLHSV